MPTLDFSHMTLLLSSVLERSLCHWVSTVTSDMSLSPRSQLGTFLPLGLPGSSGSSIDRTFVFSTSSVRCRFLELTACTMV